MSSNVHVATTSRNGMIDNLAARLNNGFIKVYSGTQPANANTALSGNTLLVTHGFGATAFGSAASGSATANAISSGVIAASGTATFARLYESDGTTAVMDISVGSSGADLNYPTTTFTAAVTATISSFTLSITA
jgi:hypothetical protein